MSDTATTVEHCDWRDFIETTADTLASTVEALDVYFKPFAKPGSPCPGCGKPVFGKDFMESMLFATFRWGICHGHGNCNECGWPAVACHYIKNADGEDILSMQNFGLVLHPDYVTKREPETAA